jgi:hypothetical protein
MKKFVAFFALLSLLAVFVPAMQADACDNGTCTGGNGATGTVVTVPANGGTTVNNANAANPSNNQATTANSVANPIGQNTNVQVNNNAGGTYGFAPGVVCQGPQIAANAFDANSNVVGYTGSTQTIGGTIGVIIPIANQSYKDCLNLSHEIVAQRQLDTCMSVAKSGFRFDPVVYPDLAKRCAGLVPVVAVVAPPPPPQIIEKPVPYAVPGPTQIKFVDMAKYTPPACLPDYDRDADLLALHSMRHQLHTYHQTAAFIALHKKLSKACNVNSAQILNALDG